MLRTRIKASAVTNLTDARYFAAWEVTWMGFCLDPRDPLYLPPRELEAIRGWVDGPQFVGEFNGQPGEEIRQTAEMLRLDAVQAGPLTTREALLDLDRALPVIKAFAVERDTDPDALAEGLEAFAPLAGLFLLEAQASGLSWDDLLAGRPFPVARLAELCQTYPILLSIDLQPEQVDQVLRQLRPAGLSLRGGVEERVGFKSFDELDRIMEALED